MPDRDLPDSAAPTGERALEALRAAVEGTARASGEALFPALCQALCDALAVPHALVSEVHAEGRRVQVLAACWDGAHAEPFAYSLRGTPCGVAFERGETTFFPTGVAARFPEDLALARRGIDAYLGTPLFDSGGQKIGVLCVMSAGTIDLSRGPRAILEIFAARAASEIERLRLQGQLMRSQRLEGMGGSPRASPTTSTTSSPSSSPTRSSPTPRCLPAARCATSSRPSTTRRTARPG